MQCEMLLVNSETVGDKRFLESVSTGLNEFLMNSLSMII